MTARKDLLVINDVSELERHRPAIRGFLNVGYRGAYRMVNASRVREKVFGHLRVQTGKHGKYDLIFLGDRGGTLLFMGPELRQFGTRIMRLPYSMHTEEPWETTILHEVRKLGPKPRVLLLEGDIGGIGHTAFKLRAARNLITQLRADARVRTVAGIANREKKKKAVLDYSAGITGAHVKRLSEIVDDVAHTDVSTGYTKGEGLKRLKEMQKLRACRGMTGTLPH